MFKFKIGVMFVLAGVFVYGQDRGVGKKATVLNATVELSGPMAEIEKWAKKINVKKIIAQVDPAQ